jgi:Domain of unknown function (DUF4203)
MFLAQIAPPNIQLNLPANVPPDWMPWLTLALGVVVLLFGRALYWAFVAIVGFLVGMTLAQTWPWLNEQTQVVQLLAALGCGLLGAILGVLVQRLAFAIGGFFAGCYLAHAIAAHFHWGGDPHIWTIGGGIIGAIVAAMIMDWAIIVLSSLAGAAAILTPFQTKLDDRFVGILFLVLAVVGIVFQSRRLVRPVATPAAPPPPA